MLATTPKLDILRQVARKAKHRTLQEEGVLLVARGVTSIQELLRVSSNRCSTMFLTILLIVVFVACFASLMIGGLWSNTLTLVNVLTAGLVATNYFEPLADWFDAQEPAYTYLCDFIAIWLIFGIMMTLLRTLTDYMSQVKVKFFMPVEQAGGMLMACWVSWVIVCFTHRHAAHGPAGTQLSARRVSTQARRQDVLSAGSRSQVAGLDAPRIAGFPVTTERYRAVRRTRRLYHPLRRPARFVGKANLVLDAKGRAASQLMPTPAATPIE